VALHNGDPGLEPIGKHRPAAGLDQPDRGDLIPGQERAFPRSAKDDAFLHELETWSHRAAHGEEPDQRRRDRRPPDAPTGQQQQQAARLGDARQREEQCPGEPRVDHRHATTRTPPGTISARSTLPRWTSPSTSYHWTSGALISTDRALRWSMLLPSARWRKIRQSTPARSAAVRGR